MRISVALCTFNGGPYIGEQLESINGQSRLPDELIVSDDGSDDETLKIVKAFAATAPFPVRVFVNQNNLGVRKNFESAISHCEGDVIALCDQDDLWRSDKLELAEALFSSAPSVGLIFTDAQLVDEASRPIGRNLWTSVGFDSRKQALVRRGKALDVLVVRNIVTGATVAFRSSFREQIIPIPTEGSLFHDGWIGLIIAALADVAFIDMPLIKYRQHSRQLVGTEGLSTLQSIFRAERTDPKDYLSQASQFEQAYQRLASVGGESYNARALSKLRHKIVHLRTRATMPALRTSRLPKVIGEIVNRHYHNYSRGFYSAAKDLLV